VRAVALLAFALAGCSLSSWNPPDSPNDVPPSFGPCGSWVDCSNVEVITNPNDRCCPPTTACSVDDGGPYCAADSNYDPTEPVTWNAKKTRFARAAHHD
jgi:hypothetical protein